MVSWLVIFFLLPSLVQNIWAVQTCRFQRHPKMTELTTAMIKIVILCVCVWRTTYSWWIFLFFLKFCMHYFSQYFFFFMSRDRPKSRVGSITPIQVYNQQFYFCALSHAVVIAITNCSLCQVFFLVCVKSVVLFTMNAAVMANMFATMFATRLQSHFSPHVKTVTLYNATVTPVT